jgi:hypothetical protein
MGVERPEFEHGAGVLGEPGKWLPRLLRLLDGQVELAGALDRLSQRQTDLLGSGDVAGVLVILGERQPIVDRLVATAAELEPFIRRMGELLPGLAAPERAEVVSRVARIDELLGAVGARDEADGAALAAQRQRVGQELAELSKGGTALRAYGGEAGPVGPAFQDHQG